MNESARKKFYYCLDAYEAFDKKVLSGWKTNISIVVVAATIYIVPDDNLPYFVSALGLTHLFYKAKT